MKNTIQPTSIREIEAFFWRQLLREPYLLSGAFLIVPAVILRIVMTPLFIASAFSSLAAGHEVNPRFLLFAAASLAGGILLEHMSSKFETEMNIRNARALYQQCFKWLIRQDYTFYTNEFVGSLVAQSNRLVKANELHTFIFFTQALSLLASVLSVLAIMIHFNLSIGLAAASVWAGSIYLAGFLTIKRMPIRREAVAADSRQTGVLSDALSNSIAIKTFANERYEESRYDKGNLFRADRYRDSWALALRNGTTIRILAAILQMTVFIGGVIAIQGHSISLATFLLFQVYVVIIINSIFESQLLVRNLEGAYGDADEMLQLFKKEPAVKDLAKTEPNQISKGEIVFNKVTFSYPGSGDSSKALFEDLTLRIEPGEKVGLVGPSGGGKTTFTKLLLRFLDADSGSIEIDGQAIKQLKQDDLHASISYVPQEPLLFHRSLKENISYGSPNASMKEIEAAAKKAHAAEFIGDLDRGYDTLVGERGVKLSGGQRQRIALARTILKKAPILILDEPTSALDSESEAFVQEALWKLMEDKTAVVIAHRLSTIKHLDRIIVLDNGRIIEEGTHEGLLEQDGAYAKLWSRQSGGFIK